MVTIASSAQPGTVQIQAECEGFTANVNLALTDQPIVAYVDFNQSSYTSFIPGTVTVGAQAFTSSGTVVSGASITYSLVSSYTGVSIDSTTGVVTITSSAQPGIVQIQAECEGFTANVNLALANLPTVAYIEFNQSSYTSLIPGTVTVGAQAFTSSGTVVSGASITYSLVSSYTGVSINSTTGVVTITSSAQPGIVQIQAECEGFTVNVYLALSAPLGDNQISIYAINGKTYDISITASDMTSFSGVTFTITYDSTVFEIADLCALTNSAELITGSSALGVTFTSVAPGRVSFTVSKTIPAGKDWSGVLNVIRFKAKKNALNSVITVN